MYLEQRHHLRLHLDDTLHQCLSQSCLQGGNALHRRRQLTVVTSQYHPADATHGNPAGGLQCLCRLVDKQRAELHAVQQPMGRTHQRAGNDTCLAEQFGVDAYLQFRGTAFQAFQLLVDGFSPLAVTAQFADGLTDGPQLRVVRMCLEAPFVGKAQHLVVDTRRVADAQHMDSPVNELFRNPIDGHVTLGAHQNLRLPHQRLTYSLHQRRRLTRSRRSVYDGHVLGMQHLVDCPLLGSIQIAETHVFESQCLGLLSGIEKVPQITQPSLGTQHAVQGIKHAAVARLVKRQLHARLSFCPLKVQ